MDENPLSAFADDATAEPPLPLLSEKPDGMKYLNAAGDALGGEGAAKRLDGERCEPPKPFNRRTDWRYS